MIVENADKKKTRDEPRRTRYEANERAVLVERRYIAHLVKTTDEKKK